MSDVELEVQLRQSLVHRRLIEMRQDTRWPPNQTWIDSPVSGAFFEHWTGPELMNEFMSSGPVLENS